jgi:uncharacterized membrane protein YbjE (DUF340 family)
MFTLMSVAAGMLLFKEIVFDPIVQKAILFALGLLLAFIGVYLTNSNGSEDSIVDYDFNYVDVDFEQE